MRIVIIGAGAMGSIYGARLSGNADVTLIDTNCALVERINSSGIILEENGSERCFSVKARLSAEGIEEADLIILFTKSIFSRQALSSVKCLIGKETYLMTLQNGAGHERILSEFQDMEHIIIGTTEDNGAVLDLARIHHGGNGVTNIGFISGNPDKVFLERLKDVFNSSGFDLRVKENIELIIWDKLMTNASLSALTAVLQCDMSYIAENAYAFRLCRTLIKEATEVANAMGLGFDEEAYASRIRDISLRNRGSYTSIMKDIEKGRKTEVDTISGAVVSKAEELGISVPTHRAIVNLIHALEK